MSHLDTPDQAPNNMGYYRSLSTERLRKMKDDRRAEIVLEERKAKGQSSPQSEAQGSAPTADALHERIKTAYQLARAATATEEGRKAIDFFYHVHLNSYPGIEHSEQSREQSPTPSSLPSFGSQAREILQQMLVDYTAWVNGEPIAWNVKKDETIEALTSLVEWVIGPDEYNLPITDIVRTQTELEDEYIHRQIRDELRAEQRKRLKGTET